jgi:hypothetical protein
MMYQLEENLISGGSGSNLLHFEEARKLDCQALMPEYGLRNSRAHRFNFREGLRITAGGVVAVFVSRIGTCL